MLVHKKKRWYYIGIYVYRKLFSLKEVFYVANPLAVSNNILLKAHDHKEDITPMQLQKLLYMLHARYYALTGQLLVEGRFERWKYGPVLPIVHEYFKSYGEKPITSFAFIGNDILVVNEDKNNDFNRALDFVWQKHGGKSGQELSFITHLPGTAWHNAYARDDIFLRDEEIKQDGGDESSIFNKKKAGLYVKDS